MLCRAAVAICLLAILDVGGLQGALAQSAPAASHAASPASPTAATPASPPAASPDNAPVAAAAPSDSMEQPMVGDHWSYEIHDDITGVQKGTNVETVTDVTPTEIGVRVEWLGKPGTGYFIYDHSWDMKNNQILKFSPSDGNGVKLPLKVGDHWKFQSNDFNSTHGLTFKRTGSSKVVAAESMTTGAGTFDTFKIETSVSVRNANDPTKKAESATTTWYAPSVDHWVKKTSKTLANGHVNQSITAELVDYGRR
jgi:hypothetical protein